MSDTSKDERLWAAACHLISLAHFIPVSPIVGPLIVWMIKRDEFPLVNDQGKESLNFQISMLIYFAIAIALCFAFIGFLILPLLGLLYLILVIVATVKAYDGVAYRYPFTIRLIK